MELLRSGFIAGLLLAAALASAPKVAAAPTSFPERQPWKTVGDWDIAYLPSNHGCRAEISYKSGIVFDFGYAAVGGKNYQFLILVEPNWTSFENGKHYSVMVRLGAGAPMTLDMVARTFGNKQGLLAAEDFTLPHAEKVYREFATANRMMWVYDGKSSGVLPMDHALDAFNEMNACSEHYLQDTAASPPKPAPSASAAPKPAPAAPSASASEGGPTHWKSIGNWDIVHTGKDCLATTTFDNGSHFTIGLVTLDSQLLLDVVVAGPGWTWIDDGRNYPVGVQFGNDPPQTLDMTGSINPAGAMLYWQPEAHSSAVNSFLTEFGKAASMTWVWNGKSSGPLPLTDGAAALREQVKCSQHYAQPATASQAQPTPATPAAPKPAPAAPPASAPASGTSTPWKTVGDWLISYGPPPDSWCQAMRTFDNHVLIFLNLVPYGGQRLLLIQFYDPVWMSIQDGKQYSVGVWFGGKALQTLDMTGSVDANGASLMFVDRIDSPVVASFLKEFRTAKRMMWIWKGNSSGPLPLTDAGAAYQEDAKCLQRYANVAVPQGSSSGGDAASK